MRHFGKEPKKQHFGKEPKKQNHKGLRLKVDKYHTNEEKDISISFLTSKDK